MLPYLTSPSTQFSSKIIYIVTTFQGAPSYLVFVFLVEVEGRIGAPDGTHQVVDAVETELLSGMTVGVEKLVGSNPR